MRIVRDPAQMPPCVLVLGMFDGVHRGHQALLSAGRSLGQSLRLPVTVCAFEPHPLAILKPEAAPPRLTTLTERARLMAENGVDALCVTAFTAARANQEPEAFLDELMRIYRPAAVVCGFNFTFGRGGRGNGELLRAYGQAHGFDVSVVPKVTLLGDTVSSTRIRRLLSSGALDEAVALLGHPYTLTGRVAGGKQIGRTMGFPTANVTPPRNKALPAFGVYVCRMETERQAYPAVVNVGRHPTLPEGGVTVEAYALHEHLTLYGKKVRLTFLRFLRPERRFESVEALRAQIARDTQDAQRYFQATESAD